MNKTLKAKTFFKFLKTRFIDNQPFILTHLVTNRCNANCKMCLWKNNKTPEMSLAQIKRFYKNARSCGFLYLAIWGGEPLLRKDIKEILAYAKSLKFHITFFTNGFLLKQKAKEIVPFVDRLIISLDFPDKRHDKERCLPNLFERIKQGIKEFKSLKTGTKINVDCILTKLNQNCIKQMSEFAKKQDIFITFGGMIIDKHNKSLALPQNKNREISKEIRFYKKQGYPILNSSINLDLLAKGSIKNFCAYTRTVLSVNADGLINPSCTPIHNNKDNIFPKGLKKYLSSKKFRQFQKDTVKCTFCKDCLLFQEAAEIWSLNPAVFIESLKYHL